RQRGVQSRRCGERDAEDDRDQVRRRSLRYHSRAMTNASAIKVIVSDVDGVWTDGSIIYLGEQREIKAFNVRDGLAAKLAQRAGITVALLTSRRSPALVRRARELGIVELHQGAANKLTACAQLLARLELRFDQVLYAGDD